MVRTLLRPALLCLLASCASYPERTAQAYAAFESGRLDEAARLYADPKTTDSTFLCGVEAGSVAFAAGDWPAVVDHFTAAHGAVEEFEQRALVSAADAGEMLVTWTINDSFAAYRGEGFERVMLHACLGLGYLASGRMEDAGVEARLANRLLESEEALYEKSYAAGGLGHLLSAVVYELFDRPDEAYIDYKRMLDKGVGVEIAGRAAVRLSKRIGFSDEHAKWVERFGEDPKRPDDAASIVVIAGVGQGPYKEAYTLPIPTHGGLLQWSVPTLIARPQAVDALELELGDGGGRVRTSVVENVYDVTRENLEDRIAWLAAKSAVRAVLKRELTQQLEKDHGLLGAIAGTVFTVITERADLRAWQTLPHTWQAARAFVPAGPHVLRLSAIGGESRIVGSFELSPGETMFVLARTVGPRLYAHPIGGKRLDPPAPAAAGETTTEDATKLASPDDVSGKPWI